MLATCFCSCYFKCSKISRSMNRYSVPEFDMEAFRKALKSYLQKHGLLVECEDILRHKRFTFHPEWFRLRGITLVRIIQYPGDYIVTFPMGYHFGFNIGFNVNEAVNFGTQRWINWAKIMATKCSCGCVFFLSSSTEGVQCTVCRTRRNASDRARIFSCCIL